MAKEELHSGLGKIGCRANKTENDLISGDFIRSNGLIWVNLEASGGGEDWSEVASVIRVIYSIGK